MRLNSDPTEVFQATDVCVHGVMWWFHLNNFECRRLLVLLIRWAMWRSVPWLQTTLCFLQVTLKTLIVHTDLIKGLRRRWWHQLGLSWNPRRGLWLIAGFSQEMHVIRVLSYRSVLRFRLFLSTLLVPGSRRASILMVEWSELQNGPFSRMRPLKEAETHRSAGVQSCSSVRHTKANWNGPVDAFLTWCIGFWSLTHTSESSAFSLI